MRKLNIPKSWDDIIVAKAIEISSVSSSDRVSHLLSKLGVEGANKLKLEEAAEASASLKFLTELPTDNPKEITINKKVYTRKEHSKLTLAEFIDVDVLVNRGALDNVHQLAAILFTDEKEYDIFNRRKRAEIILSAPFSQVWQPVQDLLTYRMDTFKTYEGLFGTFDDKDAEEQQTPDEYTTKWGWTTYLNVLCSDDILKHDDMLKVNHVECLNQLAFFTERRAYLEEKQRLKERKG